MSSIRLTLACALLFAACSPGGERGSRGSGAEPEAANETTDRLREAIERLRNGKTS